MAHAFFPQRVKRRFTWDSSFLLNPCQLLRRWLWLISSFQLDTTAGPKPRSRKRTSTYLIRSMRTVRVLFRHASVYGLMAYRSCLQSDRAAPRRPGSGPPPDVPTTRSSTELPERTEGGPTSALTPP